MARISSSLFAPIRKRGWQPTSGLLLFACACLSLAFAGHFLVGLHAALLIRRLRRDPDPRGAALAQAVFDAMFADMDINLREMGVSDLTVGKRVKRMWEAFHGRAQAYEAGRSRQANLRVLSNLDLEQQVGSDGATWIDRQLVSRNRIALANVGFGAEVEKAFEARKDGGFRVTVDAPGLGPEDGGQYFAHWSA